MKSVTVPLSATHEGATGSTVYIEKSSSVKCINNTFLMNTVACNNKSGLHYTHHFYISAYFHSFATMLLSNSSAMIYNCDFFNNTVCSGGILVVQDGGNVTIFNSSFADNMVNSNYTSFGTIFDRNSYTTIKSCTFSNNSSGAIAAILSMKVEVDNCMIRKSTGQLHGALVVIQSNLTLNNLTFTDNTLTVIQGYNNSLLAEFNSIYL